jgi:YidC/Oxa1 family membrane protein insertase
MPKDTGPNMEMRALLAIVLSIAVLSLYQYFFAPAPVIVSPPAEGGAGLVERGAGEGEGPGSPSAAGRPAARGDAVDRSPAAGEGGTAEEQEDDAEAAGPRPATGAAAEQVVTIETTLYRAAITNRGGRLESFVLLDYDSDEGGPLELVLDSYADANRLPLDVLVPADPRTEEAANTALFTVSVDGTATASPRVAAAPDENESTVVVLEWSDGAGAWLRKELRFVDGSYQVELDVAGDLHGAREAFVALGPGLVAGSADTQNRWLTDGAVMFREGELEHLAADDLESPVAIEGEVSWAGVESGYFLAAFLIDDGAGLRVIAEPGRADGEGEETEAARARVAMRIAAGGTRGPVFIGPKKFDLLRQQGYALAEAIDFGFFGFLAKPLLWLLVRIHGVVLNYGLAIILLTALIRLLFLPLNHKSMVSMRRTQKLQPQIAAIRARYKGVKDMQKRQQMNDEVMALYRKEGVSPFGGCLPMLAQLPVLFALYSLLSVAIELRHAPFVLWIEDLSKYDPYLVLPLLMGASMFYQMGQTPTGDPNTARMQRMMPIIFTALFLYVPSGLVLYWLTNNVLGIGQQAYINRTLEGGKGPAPTRRSGKKGGKKAAKGPKGKRGKQ